VRALREMLPDLVALDVVPADVSANLERLFDKGAELLDVAESERLSSREEWLIDQAFLKAWEFCLPSSREGATPEDVARQSVAFMVALREELEQRRRADRPTEPPKAPPASHVEAAE
jgi:hypothetical protein